ncbi:hypothetical protein Q9L58_009205 [Maublancomyces gigas]|uniref:Ankyrin n=1 Tax=Discina gigas TaxID=1032678 RepID=A0ABR3G7J1_9PEZI
MPLLDLPNELPLCIACRADTATLAITLGASPNVLLRKTHHLEHSAAYIRLGTPVEIAMRMCIRSADQPSLATLMSLLHAGGNPTIEPLSILADAGNLALLARCLPYITAINQCDSHTGYTPLETADAAGHVSTGKLLLAAGASALLDAGADATWEHEGVSLVERVLQTDRSWQDVDGNVDLLARHGARVPKGEEAIALWQAPVWERWTGGGSSEVVERAMEQVVGPLPRADTVLVHNDYRGLLGGVGTVVCAAGVGAWVFVSVVSVREDAWVLCCEGGG